MKILLAEDGAVDALILKNILERAEDVVLRARNGTDALGMLEEADDVELVISDLECPRWTESTSCGRSGSTTATRRCR